MRIRCRFILPVVGLFLFGGVTYHSLQVAGTRADRYFWWSSIRLDSKPLDGQTPVPCSDKNTDCVHWEPTVDVYPSWIARSLMLSAFPAFLSEGLIVLGLSRLGVSQITTFMVSMPLLIATWYYFLGRVVDYWVKRRTLRARAPTADD
jgi:hypothetical protein